MPGACLQLDAGRPFIPLGRCSDRLNGLARFDAFFGCMSYLRRSGRDRRQGHHLLVGLGHEGAYFKLPPADDGQGGCLDPADADNGSLPARQGHGRGAGERQVVDLIGPAALYAAA